VVLRCAGITGKPVDIVEHFVGFLPVDDSSRSILANAFL
jgi:hypothetical protein